MGIRSVISRRALDVVTMVCLTAVIAGAQWDEPSPTPAPSTSAMLNSQGKYIIKKDDCLWNITFSFYGDPFRWPTVWRANDYIRNPDLIYPDDALVIPGFGGYAAAGGGLQNAAGEDNFASQTKGFLERNAALSAAIPSGGGGDLYADALRVMRARNSFAPEFLARVPFLWTSEDSRGELLPGNAVVSADKDRVDYKEFDLLKLRPFAEASYAVGDTVEIYSRDRKVSFGGQPASLVHRSGRAVVRKTGGGELQALLYKQWDLVRPGDRVAALTRVPRVSVEGLMDPQVVIRGSVFQRCENTESPYLYQHFIIDKGRIDGVMLGDLFMAYPVEGGQEQPQPQMLGCVVLCGERYATLVIIKMFSTRLKPGDRVSLVKRLTTTSSQTGEEL